MSADECGWLHSGNWEVEWIHTFRQYAREEWTTKRQKIKWTEHPWNTIEQPANNLRLIVGQIYFPNTRSKNSWTSSGQLFTQGWCSGSEQRVEKLILPFLCFFSLLFGDASNIFWNTSTDGKKSILTTN